MESIARAALGQMWLKDALGAIIICSVTSKTAVKYGARSERYAIMEAGSAVHNVYLQAAASGLGTVAVGAFVQEPLEHLLQTSN